MVSEREIETTVSIKGSFEELTLPNNMNASHTEKVLINNIILKSV